MHIKWLSVYQKKIGNTVLVIQFGFGRGVWDVFTRVSIVAGSEEKVAWTTRGWLSRKNYNTHLGQLSKFYREDNIESIIQAITSIKSTTYIFFLWRRFFIAR